MGRRRTQRWQVQVVGAPASPAARDRLRRAVDLLLRAAADRERAAVTRPPVPEQPTPPAEGRAGGEPR